MVRLVDKTVLQGRGLEMYLFQKLSLKAGFDDYIDLVIDRVARTVNVTYLSGQVYGMSSKIDGIPTATPAEIARTLFERIEKEGINEWSKNGLRMLREAAFQA